MSKKLAYIFLTIILILGIGLVYFVPRQKYQSKEITKKILESVPMQTHFWIGRDIDNVITQFEGDAYNFLSNMVARNFFNPRLKEVVTLVVLDAGNFHYPKVCFSGGGFSSNEQEMRKIEIAGKKFPVHILLNEKPGTQILSVYYIIIDKEIVPTWVEQKIKQLVYSLFNKKKVGIMLRVDIEVKNSFDSSFKVVENFLNDLYLSLNSETQEYLFGKKSQ